MSNLHWFVPRNDGRFNPNDNYGDDPFNPTFVARLTVINLIPTDENYSIVLINSLRTGRKWPPFCRRLSNAFAWMKWIVFRFQFHWNLSRRQHFSGDESVIIKPLHEPTMTQLTHTYSAPTGPSDWVLNKTTLFCLSSWWCFFFCFAFLESFFGQELSALHGLMSIMTQIRIRY